MTAEAGNEATSVLVLVQVVDINDNPPVFLQPEPRLTIIEEDDRDLPATITRVRRATRMRQGGSGQDISLINTLPCTRQVEAVDADERDAGRLVFRLRGDGVEQPSGEDAFFTINAHTGDLIQLRVGVRPRLRSRTPRGLGTLIKK